MIWDESYVNGFFYFADRGTDEFGVIESVRILHVFREVLLHLLHAFIYRIGYLYMVGTRLGITTIPTMGTPFIFM